jgi:hypothetical protein
MADTPISRQRPAPKEALPALDGHIIEPTYWYPNEFAVTVRTPVPPSQEQLQQISARLKRLLSEVGLNVAPFYAGGQRLSHAGLAFAQQVSKGEATNEDQKYVEVEIEVGHTRTKTWVEAELEDQWQSECKRRPNRFPGVYVFGSGPTGIAIIFYKILTHRRHPVQGRDSVQVAVDQINRSLHQRNPETDDLRILAAMPNWLTAPSLSGHQPPTGPGAPPIWSPMLSAGGRWKFKQQPFADLINRTQNSSREVTVIILDTSPGSAKEVIQRALSLSGYSKNTLLEQIVDDLQTGKMIIDMAHKQPPDIYRSGLDELGRPYGYNMADHGLFVTGIIRTIVPQAKIKLSCIQNEYGAGDMNTFIDALEEIGQRQDTHEVVLNLSLGALPPLEELHQIWFGSACCCQGPAFADALRTLEQLQLGMRLAIRSLAEQGVVIVAAAGNDSLGKNPAHGPRYPARYEEVLGVAAVDREGEAAAYSNQANVDHWGSGIATYGGEMPNDDSETLAWYLAKSSKRPGPPDAPHGLYLNQNYPPLNADESGSRGSNISGWAWWSGTSFATPVASGLAAHYILDGKQGQQVIKALLNDLAAANAKYEPRLQAPVLEVQEE